MYRHKFFQMVLRCLNKKRITTMYVDCYVPLIAKFKQVHHYLKIDCGTGGGGGGGNDKDLICWCSFSD